MRREGSPGVIGVLGAGAMGSLFAGSLALAGQPVLLLARPSPHVDAMIASGLRVVEPDGGTRIAFPDLSVEPSAAAGVSVLLVLVKSWATGDAAAAIAPWLPPGCLVVTLQNGLGNREAILRGCPAHDPSLVLAGVTSEAALAHGPGTVAHTGHGLTLLDSGGGVGPAAGMVAATCEALSLAGLPATPEAAIETALWRKLAVNAAINGVTALAGVENGAILADPGLLETALRAAHEVAAVARRGGIDCGDVGRAVTGVAGATAANRSSMLRDLETGRRTERDAIYGAVSRAARERHAEAPVCETLGALVGARERRALATIGEANR